MYKKLALFNGILLAVMIFLNGLLGHFIGPYFSTLVFHTVGLLLILIFCVIKRNIVLNVRSLPIISFLPGVLNVAVILLNNLCIPQIGITLTIATSLYGQLVTSTLMESFGLLGLSAVRFRKEKMLGFSLISLGVIAMVTL